MTTTQNTPTVAGFAFRPDYISEDGDDISFSDTEWEVMMADPARFGYALPCGHPITPDGDCFACDAAFCDAARAAEGQA